MDTQLDEQRQEQRPGEAPVRGRAKSVTMAAFFAGATAVAAFLGGSAARPGVWYRSLRKAKANPPPAVFGPVWTVLYASIAYSGWRTWRAAPSPDRTRALAWWGGQLALNAAWSPLFFGARRPRESLAVVGAMVPAIAGYMHAAGKVDRAAARIVSPYLLWTSFAAYLNFEIVRKNSTRV